MILFKMLSFSMHAIMHMYHDLYDFRGYHVNRKFFARRVLFVCILQILQFPLGFLSRGVYGFVYVIVIILRQMCLYLLSSCYTCTWICTYDTQLYITMSPNKHNESLQKVKIKPMYL